MRPTQRQPRVQWHPDGEYVRLTYLLDDMEPEGGGTAFFGGSHRAAAREGDRLVDNANAEGGVGSGVPEWLNAPGPAGHGPGTWVPVDAPGVWRAAGAAGSVIVNYTMTWHTRTPNYSEQPRRIIWIVYKRASEPQPSRYPSVPQDDGQGWGEAKKQWADCKCGGSPFASSVKASASAVVAQTRMGWRWATRSGSCAGWTWIRA